MFVFHSKDKDTNSSSNSDLIFKKVNLQKVSYFKIEYIHLFYSWYNISSSSNQIRINNSSTVSVTPGSYDSNTLATALQTALQVVDATFTCTYSATTNKFTIARSTVFTMNLSSSLFTMKRQLGFNSTSDTASATSQVSDSCINIHNGNSITFHSDILGKALNNKFSDVRSDFVMSIPINVNPGDIIYYQPTTDNIYKFNEPINISEHVTFIFKDIDSNTIDLNGTHWEMKIIYW